MEGNITDAQGIYCSTCGKPVDPESVVQLRQEDCAAWFCSRACLIKGVTKGIRFAYEAVAASVER